MILDFGFERTAQRELRATPACRQAGRPELPLRQNKMRTLNVQLTTFNPARVAFLRLDVGR